MLQIHLDVDPSNKRDLGLALAIFNAIGQFAVHSGLGAEREGPQQGPQGPAPAAAPAPKAPRKPRGGAAAAQAPQGNGPADGQEPELFPHAHPDRPQQPGAPSASFGQPVPGQPGPGFGTLGGVPQTQPVDIKAQLHSELRNFSTVCGPMALQGLLAYFGAQRSSDLPMERAEEIFGYIRAARAQMVQAQGPVQ